MSQESDAKRDKYYRKKYGVGLDWYNNKLKEQNYACGICKKPQSYFKHRLNLDHDHKTGEPRGLLCYYCNRRFLGRHTKETVLKLVAYLLPGKKVS